VIERLTGTVAVRGADGVVIEVGGVGFLVEVSATTMRDVPAVGAPMTLFTHLHVREEALQLFGFSTEEERELFRLFLGVSKIGPKLALAALSCRRAPDLKRALAAGDVALFASVPGIGRKTAERLILELREKVGEPGVAGAGGLPREGLTDDGAMSLARAALVELGYTGPDADKLLARLDPALPVEELVRKALSGRV
jgi:Holliday junction DNA helicase RuvA